MSDPTPRRQTADDQNRHDPDRCGQDRYGQDPGGRRCGATTRGGDPCRAYPVFRKTRCRMHGGAPGSGAPPGNRNAVTHGLTTRAAKAHRRALNRLMADAERLLREMG